MRIDDQIWSQAFLLQCEIPKKVPSVSREHAAATHGRLGSIGIGIVVDLPSQQLGGDQQHPITVAKLAGGDAWW